MMKTGLVEAIDSLVPLDEHFATFQGTDIQKESQKRPNQARDGKDKVNPKPKSIRSQTIGSGGNPPRLRGAIVVPNYCEQNFEIIADGST
ncbi:hypothetical protein Tco_1491043 [Tanacetum coccineum]